MAEWGVKIINQPGVNFASNHHVYAGADAEQEKDIIALSF